MDTNKMREQISKEFKAWFADYEKSREASGWMPLEPFVATHMHNAFIASREAVVVELPAMLPEEEDQVGEDWPVNEAYNNGIKGAMVAIKAQGLKVAP